MTIEIRKDAPAINQIADQLKAQLDEREISELCYFLRPRAGDGERKTCKSCGLTNKCAGHDEEPDCWEPPAPAPGTGDGLALVIDDGVTFTVPFASPALGAEEVARETSDPVQAARWLGQKVEADKACDDESQPSRYDEDTDEVVELPIQGRLTGVAEDCAWIDMGDCEQVAVEYPIRLRAWAGGKG